MGINTATSRPFDRGYATYCYPYYDGVRPSKSKNLPLVSFIIVFVLIGAMLASAIA